MSAAADRAGACAVRAAASARSSATTSTGGYRIVSALDRDGPEPAGRAVLHARRATAGAARMGGPYLPRAFSVAEAERRDDGVRLDFLLEAIGPGTARLAALSAGERLQLTGPARARRSRPPASSSPGAAGAILVGGGIGIAPLAMLRRGARRARRRRSGSCSAFATEPTPAGSSCFAARRCGPRSEDGHTRPPGLRHRPARGAARGRRRGRRRRLRLRAAGDARGGARDLRRARGRRRAGDGDADGLRVRLLLRLRGPARATAATCGSASTGRWSTRRRSRRALVAGSGH